MKRIVLFIVALFIFQATFAQKTSKDTVLFTYGSQSVTVSEFRKGFTKNDKAGTKHTAADVDEYLNLYKKFKLKVKDAYQQGLDTTEGFKSELATYRKQIAKPYLTDRVVNEQLVNEAYQRMQQEVNAAHILIFTKRDASPADTLIAFNKIQKIKAEIEAGTISFEDAAVQYSEDPTAKDNKGGLGYFSAFQMIYDFENQAFNTGINNVSKAFRTDFGYHILKVYDKRASKGEVVVKQILIQTNANPTDEEIKEAEAKINEVYKKLQMGEKFENLVNQYSEDANSVMKNGELPPFSMTNNRIPENFKSTAFSLLNDGDYSRPIMTSNGFHILKRVSLKPIGSITDLKPTILNRINRDSRQYKNTLAVYNRALKYYNVKDNKKGSAALNKYINDDILKGVFAPDLVNPKMVKLSNTVLFSLSKIKKNFTIKDFAEWLVNFQKPSNSTSKMSVIQSYLNGYKMSAIMEYYENDLENVNDTFANLYREYKEGILLFTLTDKKVWTKSVEDTVGLKNFYTENQNQYVFKDRYDATIIRCANKTIAEQVKIDLEKGITIDSILRKHNKSNPLNIVTPTTGKFENKDNFYANYLFNESSLNQKYLIFEDPKSTGGFVVIQVHKFIPSSKKTLNEARGTIISDYQTYLEKIWIEDLMKQYPIIVNDSVYNTLKANLIR